MKFVYYEAGTGEIKQISPVRDEDPKDPFIEVEDVEVEDLFSGKESTLKYFVKPLSKTSPVGKLIRKEKPVLNWSSINDWLYLVPKQSEVVECKILQNIESKTITMTVMSPNLKEWWAKSGFFGRKEFPVTACSSKDPHSNVWTKWVSSKDLLESVTFNYEGDDEFYLYTHRFFEFYVHERVGTKSI